MERHGPGMRVAMAVVGLATLGFYAVAALLVYLGARALWANRPDPVAFAVLLAAAALASGLLTYRLGPRNALEGLDARELPPNRAPAVYRIRDRLAGATNVPPPRVYVARLGEPNALTLGGRTPALVVDYSLFSLLAADEFEAVLAHEFAHLEVGDGLFQTLAYSVVHSLVGVVALALAPLGFVLRGFGVGIALVGGRPGDWRATPPGRLRTALERALTLLLVGLTALVRAHSRRREHAADDRAAAVTGNPLALARALRKIDRSTGFRFPFAPLSPRRRESGPVGRLLSTHPSVDERIERLEAAAARMERERRERDWTRIPVRD
ncbi:M48 family metallopeptidase [Halorarum salinum]|uniref:M48 family metalloprotease n=1 Tax=Halorarum salinum TaxID=2743089 RepID=A0A7D5LBQ0_9EURY|nr:M48 family metalloprotease [Halobaculum salinum]QLG62932.1 M48 family metalloprotease [Halobaculum salinum]